MSLKEFSVSWEVFVVFLHNPQLRSQRRNLRSYESLVCVPKGKALNRFELRTEKQAWDGTKTRLLRWKALVMKYFSFYFYHIPGFQSVWNKHSPERKCLHHKNAFICQNSDEVLLGNRRTQAAHALHNNQHFLRQNLLRKLKELKNSAK